MPCVLLATNVLTDILRLLFMLLAFVLVLFAACYTTKFLVKTGYIQGKTKNIELKESYRIAPNKNVQILKIGSKYIAVAVGKEEVTFLTELSEEELDLSLPDSVDYSSFNEIFHTMLHKKDEKKDKE